jgi:hypothetical protein
MKSRATIVSTPPTPSAVLLVDTVTPFVDVSYLPQFTRAATFEFH